MEEVKVKRGRGRPKKGTTIDPTTGEINIPVVVERKIPVFIPPEHKEPNQVQMLGKGNYIETITVNGTKVAIIGQASVPSGNCLLHVLARVDSHREYGTVVASYSLVRPETDKPEHIKFLDGMEFGERYVKGKKETEEEVATPISDSKEQE